MALAPLAPGLQYWSRFSEEKQIDFNGSLVTGPAGTVLVDPVAMDAAELAEARAAGASAVLLTNKDHRRAAPEIAAALGIEVWIHEADQPLLDVKAHRTFRDGDLLPGGLVALHVIDLKSPGETALHVPGAAPIVILGDALIGKPRGELSLLPVAKVPDPAKARASLRRLLAVPFDVLMLGDGSPFPRGGRAALERFLSP